VSSYDRAFDASFDDSGFGDMPGDDEAEFEPAFMPFDVDIVEMDEVWSDDALDDELAAAAFGDEGAVVGLYLRDAARVCLLAQAD